ncbi:tetratricopeptide repeat protein [Sphaerotilus uruguayifluvii]|uniref:Tetratricopeptide (TPR) repeat protein n=1 Tax=Sphaerotilus uruguayifluvii TaxID=2735897 RepID=A0ABX2G3S8_9BURK|nr:tetratricopeptide repeat protein [Leptothrix sp. C29]NRT56971.1 tetratricopeptide (TPR) repeat protein [Leptothrix sp. C29]
MLYLVAARLGQDVRWIDDLPEGCHVRLYLDERDLDALDVIRPVDVVRLPGLGRASQAHLHHLLGSSLAPAAGPAPAFTVFCDGDPLAHSPAFLDLLDQWTQWAPVQPLDCATDPALSTDRRDWISDLPVEPVRFCPATLGTLGRPDAAAWRLAARYRRRHDLPADTPLLAHALSWCGSPELASLARQADLALRPAAGLFAVRQDRLLEQVRRHAVLLQQAQARTRDDALLAQLWEFAWLLLFGLEPVRLDPLPRPARVEPAEADPQEMQTLGPAFARAMAAIDATLARSAPRQSERAPRLRLPEPIRETHPRNATPSTAAAAAFGQGDFEGAARAARQALMSEPASEPHRFMLAMALAAQGRSDEALDEFDRVMRQDPELQEGAAAAPRTGDGTTGRPPQAPRWSRV